MASEHQSVRDGADENLDLHFDDMGKTFLDRLLEKARDGLFGVLFIMAKNTQHASAITIARFLTDFFQVVSFTFSEKANFPWNRDVMRYLEFTRYVRVDLIKIFEDQQTNDLVWLVIAVVIVVLTLANALYVGIAFSRNEIRSARSLRLLREFSGLIVTIGYIPIVSVFLKVLRCQNGQSESLLLECQSGIHIVVSLLCSTLSILLFFFSGTVTACFYNAEASRTDVLARPHARAELIYLIVRSILILTFSTVDTQDSNNHLEIALILVVTSLASLAAYVFFAPYYSMRFVLFRVGLLAVWAWANVGLVMTILINEPQDSGVVLMVLIGSPLVALLSVMTMNARRMNVINTPVQNLRTAYEVELKARWYLDDEGILFEEDRKDRSPEEMEEDVKHIAFVRDLYQQSMKSFRRSSILRLFAAHFYSNILKNQQLWSTALEDAERRSPGLDENFNMYRQRKLVSEKISSSSADVLGYLEFEHTLQQAQAEIRKSLLAQRHFWSELLERVPDLSALQIIGSKINRHVSVAGAKCRHLVKLDGRSPNVLRIYASFLLYVINDQEQGVRMVERAEKLENELRQSGDVNVGWNADSGVLTIDKKTAKLTKANTVACRLLGLSASEAEGADVNSLLPEVVASGHTKMMQAFHSGTKFTKVAGKKRRFFFQHRDGSLVNVYATLRTVPRMDGDTDLIVSIEPDIVANAPGSHSAIITMPSGRVQCASRDLADALGVPYHERVHLYNLGDYVEDLKGMVDAIEELNTDQESIPCEVLCYGLPKTMRVSGRKLLTEGCVILYLTEVDAPVAATLHTDSAPELGEDFGDERHHSLGSVHKRSAKPHLLQMTSSVSLMDRTRSLGNRSVSMASSSASRPTPSRPFLKQISIRRNLLDQTNIGEVGPTLSADEGSPSASDGQQDDDDGPIRATAAAKDAAMLAHQMRTRILRDKGKVENGVLVLAIALLVSTTTILYLSSSDLVYTNDFSLQYLEEISSVRTMTEQKKDVIGVVYMMRVLVSLAPPANSNNTNALARLAFLHKAASSLIGLIEDRHAELYVRERSVDSNTARTFSHSYIDIVEKNYNSGTTYRRPVLYWDALQGMLFSAKESLQRQIGDPIRQQNLFHVVMNGPRAIHRVISELTDVHAEMAAHSLAEVRQWKDLFLGEAIALMAGLSLFVFLPTIWNVEKNKDEVLGYFLDLPLDVLKAMQQSCHETLQFGQDQTAMDYDDIHFHHGDGLSESDEAADDSSSDDEGTPLVNAGAVSSSEAKKRDQTMKRRLHTMFKTRNRLQRRKSKTKESRHRTYKKSNKQLIKFTGEVVLLLFIFLVYVVYSHTQDVKLIKLDTKANSEVYVASHIHFHARAVLTYAVESALATDPQERAFWAAASNRSLHFLEVSQQALLYGGTLDMTSLEGWEDYERPVQVLDGSAKRYPRRDVFIFEDACHEIEENDRAECYRFPADPSTPSSSDSVMFGHGYQTAYNAMLTEAYRLVRLLQNQPNHPGQAVARLYADPSTQMFEKMISRTMRLAMDAASRLYMDEVSERDARYHSSRNLVFWLFILAISMTICINYIPLMLRIDRDVKRTRAMLLLLPNAVLNEVPSIRKMVKKNFN